MARLDVPTFDDTAVQRQLEQSFPPDSRSSVAWDTVVVTLHIFSTVLQLISQLSVLNGVLRGQRDGLLLAVLSFSHTLFFWSFEVKPYLSGGAIITQLGLFLLLNTIISEVWAATTKNVDYIRMEGMKRLVSDPSHRKEIVAGGMWEYLLKGRHLVLLDRLIYLEEISTQIIKKQLKESPTRLVISMPPFPFTGLETK